MYSISYTLDLLNIYLAFIIYIKMIIYIYMYYICFTFFLDTDTCQAKSVRMILGMLICAEKYTVCSKAIFRHTTGKCHTRRGFAMLDVAKTDRLARRRQTHANEPQGVAAQVRV